MARYEDYQMERIISYPIAQYLGLDMSGARPRMMVRSPFNPSERTPSFSIDTRKNLFHCFSTEHKGGILELVMLLEGLRSHGEAADFIGRNLLGLTPDAEERTVPPARIYTPAKPVERAPEPGAIRVKKSVRPITDGALLRYIGRRGVRMEIVERYCSQVHYSTESRPDASFVSLAFPNNKPDGRGGTCLVLRNDRFKISSGQAETTIDSSGRFSLEPSSDTVLVFEGFYDYLSWLEYAGRTSPGADVVVLNSVNNISTTGEGKYSNEYISRHRRIDVFLDADAAGRRTTEAIRSLYCTGSLVVDMSCVWDGRAKDINELLLSDPERSLAEPLTGHI